MVGAQFIQLIFYLLSHKSSLGHNNDFWGQKSSQIENFWAQNVCRVILTISGAINHQYVISHQEMTKMPKLHIKCF